MNESAGWLAEIAAADAAALDALEARLLGRSGLVTELVKGVASLPADQRRAEGQRRNALKVALTEAVAARRARLAEEQVARALAASDFDPTEPGPPIAQGTLHPITIVQNELIDVFASMGFSWQDGPEIETDWFNFEALNHPPDHPARDAQDTFYVQLPGVDAASQDPRDKLLLRTHTSPVQVRTMRRFAPPLKVIVPGRVFRHETVDASHEHTFYQMEGLVVDRGVSVANLIDTMRTCLRAILRRDLEVRLRPGYFPFVEPGFELDVNCPFCSGSGCSVCKHSGWIEILPCGMVHPNVLRAGGVDPDAWSGFAFGMGLQRVVMIRYGIDDIRLFMGGDLRFLSQFRGVPQ